MATCDDTLGLKIGTVAMRSWDVRMRFLVVMGAIFGAALIAMPAQAATPYTGIGGSGPALTISAPNPASGPAGSTLVVSGSHWVPSTIVQLSIGTSANSCASTTALPGATGTVDGTGTVTITFTWPTTLVAGTYPICGDGPGAPSGGVISSNSFDELTQATPSIAIPSSVASGGSVNVTGTSWDPVNSTVELLIGVQGSNPCASSVATLTSQSDGTISGAFLAPTVSSTTTYVITAVSPAGTCSGAPAPTMHVTQTFSITAGSGGSTPTPTGSTPTPTATATPTATPGTTPTATPGVGNGTPTPLPGHGTPTATPGKGTPTPTKGTPLPGHGTPTPEPHVTSSGPCPPLPNNFCASNSGFPWWLLCLMIFGLIALFVVLLLLILWRRNQEVIVTEEDITNQINPDSVAPLGTMRFVRAVRITTQTVDRQTGAVRNSRARDYDEFTDANGNVQRRPRT